MKLQIDSPAPGSLMIRAYSPSGIQVNDALYKNSMLLLPARIISDDLPADLVALEPRHINRILELEPEILLLGTGPHQAWPDPALLAPLLRQSIGVECMTTAAACRSFNILVAEDRRVAALLLEVCTETGG